MSEESPLVFPCEFPIKVMGKSNTPVEAKVVEIINKHVPNLSEDAITTKASKAGNYMAITIIVTAKSRAHLDAIYMDLTACEHVIMAL